MEEGKGYHLLSFSLLFHRTHHVITEREIQTLEVPVGKITNKQNLKPIKEKQQLNSNSLDISQFSYTC